MAIAFAIIGDVIPARERGRYQGYFGAVFGLLQCGRSAARRLDHRHHQLALDLLHQPANRYRRAGRHLDGAEDAGGQARATRSITSAPPRSWPPSPRCCCTSTGPASTSAGPIHHCPGVRGCRHRPARSTFVFIELRAAEPIIPMRLFRNPIFTVGQRLRLPDRVRHVRRRDLPAALLADRAGHVANRVRAGNAADGGRHVQHVDRLRAAHHQDRQVQDLPDHRRRSS